MRLSDFDYHLPAGAIAQAPLDERDASRMMVVSRDGGPHGGPSLPDIDNYLETGDCLVVNDSRVIPARLSGTKDTGGTVEILLLRRRIEARIPCGHPGTAF
jgi:S-adenosylmethionine:tRNA ribosyltransferase-isomerase